jgi:hypothetical protein
MSPNATLKLTRCRHSLLLYVVRVKEAKADEKIYVSDSGNDKNDGLSEKTPIHSWQRFLQLCEGNEEIIIMGNADTGKMRLIAEIDKKGRIARGDVAPKVD